MRSSTNLSRRELLKMGAAGATLTTGALVLPRRAWAAGPESVQVAEIYELQTAFHRAKTNQDLDL